MGYWKIRQWAAVLSKKLQRAYRYSELRKLQVWLKGKTLHPVLYLATATLLVGALVGLHNYFSQFFYVVTLEGHEVGMVHDAGEIENFLVELNECCSSFYGMTVEPEQEILFNREYRSDGEEDSDGVKENLRQQISLITEAVMLTVDQVPAVPVVSEKEVAEVIDLLSSAYTSEAENVRLLEVNFVEDIACTPCSIPPEAVFAPQEAAGLLLSSETADQSRLLLASRHQGIPREGGPSEVEGVFPTVHVRTLEEVRTLESIPYTTSYTYNDKMWYAQSHVLIPGKAGEKKVTYHVTSENGEEIDRQIVEQTVLLEPVTQVVEKGTSRAPSIGTGRFLWPVQGGGRVYQSFKGRAHMGIDIIPPLGNRHPSILAADNGVVVETGSGDRRGNYIVIYHGSYYTAYLHNSINYVSTGDTVSRGQTIALMGSSGRSTGVHLHFEVRRSDGSGVWGNWYKNPAENPLNYFSP